MTFIDITGDRPTPGFIAGYSILCAIAALLGIWAMVLGRTRLHYRSFFSVRVLFPTAIFILSLENAALASSGLFYDKLIEEANGGNFEDYVFYKAIFILQTFLIPILLIVVFELTYLVHKRRSVNFCGMYFDEGRRVDNTIVMSCMLRNSIRSLALVLLIMGLAVNFDFFHDNAPVDELAGRAGWLELIEDGKEGDGGGQSVQENLHLFLSLLPTAILTLVCFYLSIMLWRYGTESAVVVHSSMLNPWFYLFFGTIALAAGQFFGEELYPIMSNTGMIIFISTILALMAEVDKDIVAAHGVANFLVQLALKGDEIRVARVALNGGMEGSTGESAGVVEGSANGHEGLAGEGRASPASQSTPIEKNSFQEPLDDHVTPRHLGTSIATEEKTMDSVDAGLGDVDITEHTTNLESKKKQLRAESETQSKPNPDLEPDEDSLENKRSLIRSPVSIVSITESVEITKQPSLDDSQTKESKQSKESGSIALDRKTLESLDMMELAENTKPLKKSSSKMNLQP